MSPGPAGSYARLLFVDFSSAFNTILPDRLVNKLLDLGISHSICLWIKNFLSDRSQKVKVVCHYSSCLSLSTGSPLLYTLYTHDCTPTHSSNTIIKFADDTTVVRFNSEGDESSYRDEVEQLLVWCIENNLALNITKTKELIIDCRRKKTDIQPLFINGDTVEDLQLPIPGRSP